jgi:hypothetical protein
VGLLVAGLRVAVAAVKPVSCGRAAWSRSLCGWRLRSLGLWGRRSPDRGGRSRVIDSGRGGGLRRRPVVTDVAQLGGVAALQAEGATLLVLAAKRVALGTMVSRRAPVAHPRDF